MPIRRLAPETRLTGATIHGNIVYLAGQVADDTTLDAEGQMKDILAQIDALLAEAGTDKRHLLTAQIFIQDFADLAGMNRAWDAWIDPAHLPARATVQARLVDPAWRIEVTGIAAIP
ncbi:MAG: RidA family protein [Acetobacteraceae bacterium]|nr:RidA family protein [Acetobacteraceae bacterium]